MDWVFNLCSCISPQLKTSIIDYLNSSQLNQQVIQEQKCTEQEGEPISEPTDHVYHRAKIHSFNFMKLEQHSDDQQQEVQKQMKRIHSENDQQQKNQELIDVFWYPALKSGDKWVHYRNIFTHKLKILLNILQQSPCSNHYDKVYDSGDDLKLVIYCRLESLIKGKKINSYRFAFDILNAKMQEYEECLKSHEEKEIYHLIDKVQQVEVDPQDPNFIMKYQLFKKLLVINPHYIMTVHKTEDKIDEQNFKYKITTAFSVEEEYSKNNKENYHKNRGWLHLCGLKVVETGQGLHFEGYINLELDVSVSPNMLKQPISKQIRNFVQKLSCCIRKSDEI